MNWIGVTVGGVVGVVGAILTLKDGKVGIPLTFATHSSGSDKSLFVPGLQNLQNNCFLNVVLQVNSRVASFSSIPKNEFLCSYSAKIIFLSLFLCFRL